MKKIYIRPEVDIMVISSESIIELSGQTIAQSGDAIKEIDGNKIISTLPSSFKQ